MKDLELLNSLINDLDIIIAEKEKQLEEERISIQAAMEAEEQMYPYEEEYYEEYYEEPPEDEYCGVDKEKYDEALKLTEQADTILDKYSDESIRKDLIEYANLRMEAARLFYLAQGGYID